MKKFSYADMKGGWFIGDFEPSAYKTKNFEAAYVKHKKNTPWPKHYHKKGTEITLIIKGKLKINDEIYSEGDILIVYPNEVVDPTFLEDVEFIVVKTVSDVNDKYIVPK